MSDRRSGLRERRRKRPQIEERQDQQELGHPARTIPLVELGQGYRMRRIEENMDGGVGFQSTGGAERARDQSYPLTIGMEGATERNTKL